MSQKKRKVFNIAEKELIIRRLENGETNISIAKELGVSHSTISTIWKDRQKVLSLFDMNSLKLKRARATGHQDIEDALLTWFKHQRRNAIAISGPVLKDKANDIARRLGVRNFNCSSSWIQRFRARHDIVSRKIYDVAASVPYSDDRVDIKDEQELFIDPAVNADMGGLDYNCCPASPTTVPAKSSRSNSSDSPMCSMSVRPARRQRTTSVNNQATTANTSECIIRTNNRTIYTAGRPPWYNCAGQQVEPFVIGICGGSASGKTTVAQKIIESLDVPWVTLLSMDCFYKILNPKQHELALMNEYNFDHPDAFDIDLLLDVLSKLKEGRKVEVPVYNFVTHSREPQTKTMYGANVIIFEGILVFHSLEILKLLDMKVFVDTDADIRLARRLKRDISQRARDLRGVLKQYLNMVKPSYTNYIAPTMAHADIIVPRGGENKVAIHLIVQHVHTQLQLRGFKLRETLANTYMDQPMPESLHLLHPTPQIRGLHTFIRSRNTSRDEFIFYSKRLIRLVIEYALSLFPFKPTIVETPQGVLYEGKRMSQKKICGVSILRAGETMEQAVCDVCKDIRIGKILIQTNQMTGEPELYYLRLPKDIKDYKVILMDATVATGAAAMMAVRVLLDHDVPEENIILASLLMAEIGVHSIAYAFPKVKIVTSALDPEINDKFYVIPGIGNFGDRYFGTEPTDDYL